MSKAKDEIRITNAWLCQIEDKSVKPTFADVTIKSGKINKVIKKDFEKFNSAQTLSDPNDFNAAGRIVTIPNVNFHDHFYSRLAKGLNVTGDTSNFFNILTNLWWKLDLALDLEMVRASAQMAAFESIKNGVTYIFDHHASPSFTIGSLQTTAEVLNDFNLRGVLCFETSDRNGNKLTNQAIIENESFFSKFQTENIKSLYGLHASFTLENDTLKTVAKYVNEFNCGIHIHLCEDKSDSELSLEKFGKNPVQRLFENNLLNEKSILAHGIHLENNDYDIISKFGSAIVYNPDSNLNNSVGLPNYESVPKSIPILCGTDGMHADPVNSYKKLFLLHRHQGNSFEQSFNWIQKIYFDQIDFVKKFFPDYTSLQVRDRADIVIWDYVPPAPMSEQNFFGHWVYGITERSVNSVMQNGKWLMNNLQLTGIDQNKLSKEIFVQGKRLAEKFQSLT
ncbi:MAG: amidohydrolase family protein [Ignavibacteria bacterium]|nr:amidohydrolase family protein [Ignavibacteria bacterium]